MTRGIEPLWTGVVVVVLVCYLVDANIRPDGGSFSRVSNRGDAVTGDAAAKVPSPLDYNKYTRFFGKIHELKEEGARRSKLFISRTLRIFQHNVMYMNGKTNYYLGQNEFTDLTAHEIAEKYHIGQGVEFEPDPSANSSLIPGESYSKSSLEEMKSRGIKPILDFNYDEYDDEDEEEDTDDDIDVLHRLRSVPELAKKIANGGSSVGKSVVSGLLGYFDYLSYVDYLDTPPDDKSGYDDDYNNDYNEGGGHQLHPPTNGEAKYDIDWRTSGCISSPKSQGSCNSCYAFAVLGLMEYFYCRQMKQPTDFSAQYMIDCGSKTQLKGCTGGKMKNVGLFINKYGIELDTIYPYSGSQTQCHYSEQDDSEHRAGYLRPQITRWQNFHELSAWSKWLQKSPVIVGINMPPDFLAYAGGIHSGSNCDQTKTHAMLLVGSGIEKGEEFWLLKNSYSEFWGEGGYFKLAKSAPSSCFNSAIVARVSFPPNRSR